MQAYSLDGGDVGWELAILFHGTRWCTFTKFGYYFLFYYFSFLTIDESAASAVSGIFCLLYSDVRFFVDGPHKGLNVITVKIDQYRPVAS